MNQLICSNLFSIRRKVPEEKKFAAALAWQDIRLNVYYNVSVSDLSSGPGQGLSSQEENHSSHPVSFLICQGDKVLIALDREPELNGPENCVLQTWTAEKLCPIPFPYHSYFSGFDTSGDVFEDPFEEMDKPPDTDPAAERLVQHLRPLENTKCLLQPVPPRVQNKLAKLRLIEPSGAGPWTPSGLGQDYGLVMGYLAMGNGRVCCTVCWSERTRKRIQDAVSWGRGSETAWEKKPLEQRVQRICDGLPGNSVYSRQIVEKFAQTPLSDYLQDEPEAYKQLEENLPPSAATYQQAAFHIHELLQREDSRALGKKLMRCLVAPIVEEVNRTRSNPKHSA